MTISRTGDRWVDQPGSLLGLLNLGIGLVLYVGSPTRTASPSLRIARDTMPMHAWALVFFLGGLICLLAHHLGREGAFLVGTGAGIYTFWTSTLLQAALTDQRAALTGIVIYGWVGLLHITTAIRLARRAG